MEAERRTYQGSCHCGAVRFEATMALEEVASCNCSRCRRLGWLLTFVPAADFHLLSGEAPLKDYQFYHKNIHHLFCSDCGIEPFARGTHPKTGDAIVAVNVRCLDGVDLASLTVREVDGASL